MKRSTYARVYGTVSGKTWSGYKASLAIDQQLDTRKPFAFQIERLVRGQGDFEWCLLDPDTVVEVCIVRHPDASRYREYGRVFPVTKFPSIARFVAAPKASSATAKP